MLGSAALIHRGKLIYKDAKARITGVEPLGPGARRHTAPQHGPFAVLYSDAVRRDFIAAGTAAGLAVSTIACIA